MIERIDTNRYTKKDCFAYREFEEGAADCDALIEFSCFNCKFYKTHELLKKQNDEVKEKILKMLKKQITK